MSEIDGSKPNVRSAREIKRSLIARAVKKGGGEPAKMRQEIYNRISAVRDPEARAAVADHLDWSMSKRFEDAAKAAALEAVYKKGSGLEFNTPNPASGRIH